MSIDLSSLNLDIFLDTARQAAQKGSDVLLEYFGKLSDIREKKMAGLVSEADIESEKVITDYLIAKHPGIPVLGEENYFNELNKGPVKNDKYKDGLRWVIDPLDGTTNYIHRFHIFCVSIGLELNGEPIAGVIQVPMLKQVFTAAKGKGAYKNNEPLKVSDKTSITESLVATGFFSPNKKALEEQLQIFTKVVNQARGVRRAGAAAYDLCMVAEGIFDAFWEKNLMPWDTCAGTILVKEAGGKVTSYGGEDFKINMDSIVAGSPFVHTQLQKMTTN